MKICGVLTVYRQPTFSFTTATDITGMIKNCIQKKMG